MATNHLRTIDTLKKEIEKLKREKSDLALDEEDTFTACDECDLPDACADFGCAIKAGIKKV